jgi:hypothetical protein
LACTDPADLVPLEPDKKESEFNWMIWMCHRAHLNDPTLTKFDFSNLQMPAGAEEPRISPKLAKAIGKNTKIESLLLPNTNLQAREAGVLAESLKTNQESKIKVLNVDSNFIASDELESLINAAGTNLAIEELRINNQHGMMFGRQHYEALKNAVVANRYLAKLGATLSDPTYRNDIDRAVLRNGDNVRKRRVEAKKAAEAAGYS